MSVLDVEMCFFSTIEGWNLICIYSVSICLCFGGIEKIDFERLNEQCLLIPVFVGGSGDGGGGVYVCVFSPSFGLLVWDYLFPVFSWL